MKKKINLKEIINNMKINRNNLTIKLFHFNFIQVNTMVIFDDTKQAMIVDPGNSNPSENEMLFSYIEKEQLQVKWILNRTFSSFLARNTNCAIFIQRIGE